MVQMIKTAIEETRLVWWVLCIEVLVRIHTGVVGASNRITHRVAVYASRIDGYIELKQMEEEEK